MTGTASTGTGGGERAPTALLDDDDATLFPKLTQAQVRMLMPLGRVRPTERGDVLFRSGDDAYDVMVVLEGSVAVRVGSGAAERELVLQQAGDLMAELNLLTGEGTD